MAKKLYHVRFEAYIDALAAARQLEGVAGVEVVGVSQSHSHGPNILVLVLSDGVTLEELSLEADALLFSDDWQPQVEDGGNENATRVVPVMNPDEVAE